uniref:Uncharacterized protein n=1 Tax=viral metagenome TaxID=1070528 RepID=A0A6C0EDG8_9ZZZZ
MTAITKKYLINGPNNVVRLTNGNKILYIFGDYHFDVQYQDECFYNDKYDSMDIDKFLLAFIRTNTIKNFDIFIEMYETSFNISEEKNYKDKYIWNFHKMVQSKIKNKYKNFRFHFTDIRDSLILNYIITDYAKLNIFNKYYSGRKYILLYTELKEILILYMKLLNKNNFIKKILNNYKNSDIKKKINIFYRTIILKNYKNLINTINKFIKFIKLKFNDSSKVINYYDLSYEDFKNFDKIDKKIAIFSNEINNLCSLLSLCITDLYFIRRFLDKNYITNGILYTGSAHLANISTLLIKLFNFKITNINYKPNDIDINKHIKKLSFNKITYIDYLCDLLTNRLPNKQVYQCTNLFNFPDNFS